MMCHVEVLEDDTLYIDNSGQTFYYQLESKDHVIIDLTDGIISISKCARIQYPHTEYWKIDLTLRPRTEARLYMSGGNDAYECAEKPLFVVIHHGGKTILEKDFY